MRVADLLPDRASLISRSYYNKKNSLGRVDVDHPFGTTPQQEHDSSTSQTRSITGAEVAAAGSAGYVIRSDDTVDLASHDTEIDWNYAIIERLNRHTLKTEIISFDLGEALDNPISPENRVLEPGDVLTLYTRSDINLPTEMRARFVRVDGEVLRPGVYEISGNETLQQVLVRAGGLTPHAYLYASQLTRESVRLSEEAKLQKYIQDATRDATSPMNNNAIGADGRPAVGDLELKQAYIRSLQAIHPTGRIMLRLSPTADSANDLLEFALQDGDQFFVPPQPNTIDVIGSVFNQGAMRFVAGKQVRNYLIAAGGNTRDGDKSQEFVLRADGSTLSRNMSRNFEKADIFAGDTIIVPARMRPGWNAFEFLSLGQFASSMALTAVALSTLK
jgi:polysaccharide biosynthesis/export protein